MIFDIQRFSVNDGPGIRTVVYLKGCNLKCEWCHNPESHNAFPEIMYFPEKCVNCGECVKICPQGACISENEEVSFLREKCVGCGRCVQVCYSGAMILAGKNVFVDEVMTEVKKDDLYYKNSAGGVTFSGGEPLLQSDFLQELLIQCKKLDYHCAIETAGNVAWINFEKILPYTDLFLYDIKLINEDLHKKLTGVSNKRIIENLRSLAKRNKQLWVRTPLIPNVNDNPNDMEVITEFVASLKADIKHEFLPYHRLGESKYESLGGVFKKIF